MRNKKKAGRPPAASADAKRGGWGGYEWRGREANLATTALFIAFASRDAAWSVVAVKVNPRGLSSGAE
jgi:hypothetical protein